MDPITNPFAPGAGAPPPELAGRTALIQQAHVAVERARRSLASQHLLMIGLRGAGKTVLLDHMRAAAEANDICTVRMDASDGRSLPSLLLPGLHRALLRLSRNRAAAAVTQRALRVMAGFVRSVRVKYADVEVGITSEPERGVADHGDLEQDLAAVLDAVAKAAAKAHTALALFIDELQYVQGKQLAALTMGLHRAVQQQSPVVLIGAGLPQLRTEIGNSKPYAERMFTFAEIGALTPAAARVAIEKPLAHHGVKIEAAALDLIVRNTHCYPYFLQEWGKRAWDVAAASPIRSRDVRAASAEAIAALDASFFQVRFSRLTGTEKRYLRAMAELGPGPHSSGDIATAAERDVRVLSKTRRHLIARGMVWSPAYGSTAFTVPLFDEFMRRIMPGEGWRST